NFVILVLTIHRRYRIMIKFYQYPNCTTCKKAAKFLQEYGVSYEPIDIVQHTPTKKEFKEIIDATGIDINKLFNTQGAKYRELVSSKAILVKRPLIVLRNKAILNFKED